MNLEKWFLWVFVVDMMINVASFVGSVKLIDSVGSFKLIDCIGSIKLIDSIGLS